jgi:Na+(H+)/acetate symporter ActP
VTPTDPTLPPGGVDFDPANPCLTPACVNAKSKLDEARAAFVSACNSFRSVREVRVLIQRVVAVPIWVIVVLVVVAIILWFLGLGWLSAILWVVILIYAVLLVISFVVVRIEASLGANLKEKGDAVAQAVSDVMTQCPEQCRGDLSVPLCN